MKVSESDPNFKLMMVKRGSSSNNVQLPSTSQHGVGGNTTPTAGGGGMSRQSSKLGGDAMKNLKVIDSRLQDKSESIGEHLSMAEAMMAKQQTTSNMSVKQGVPSKLSISSRF